MNFKQYIQEEAYPLFERNMGNKVYIISQYKNPLERYNYEDSDIYDCETRDRYVRYLNNLRKYQASSGYNYIFQVTTEIFALDVTYYRDLKYVWNNNLINWNRVEERRREENDAVIRQDMTADEFAKSVLKKLEDPESTDGFGLTWANWFKTTITRSSNFYDYFDGHIQNPWRDNPGLITVKVGALRDNLELIDGNVPRFEESGDKRINLPNYVIDDLQEYTKDASNYNAFRRKSIDWLLENFPAKDKTLYRGVGIYAGEKPSKDDAWPIQIFLDESFEEFNQKVNDILDIDIQQCKVGEEVIHDLGRRTSWSTDPIVASGFDGAAIWVLIKADMSADDILIDFTELSSEQKEKFNFHAQNEVIVETDKVPATINKVEVYRTNTTGLKGLTTEEWLENHGYEYRANQGIFKIQ